MRILENFKKEIDELRNKIYYVIECPYCHQKVLAVYEEIIPIDEDHFQVRMCPYCGHRNIIFTKDEFFKLKQITIQNL